MKKSFLGILIFFLFFHFIFPYFYYLIFGGTPIYKNWTLGNSKIWDVVSLNIGFFLNIIPLTVAIIIIFFSKDTLFYIEKKRTAVEFFFCCLVYFFSMIIIIIPIITTKSSYIPIFTKLNGTIWGYITMFLSPSIFFLLIMINFPFFVEKSKSFDILIISLIFFNFFSGSRSIAITLLIIFFILYGMNILKKYYRKFLIYIILTFLITPLIWPMCNYLRSNGFKDNSFNIFKDVSFNIFKDDSLNIFKDDSNAFTAASSSIAQIVGRISMLETSMLPIYWYRNNYENLKYFYHKYNLCHQAKILINQLVPGDIFKFDIPPNQYYRAAFLGYPLEIVKKNYCSINITLPIYLFMYKGVLISLFLSIIIYVGFYWVIYLCWKWIPLLGVIFLFNLYQLIYFFDFVVLGKLFFTSVLVLLTFMGIIWSTGGIQKLFKKKISTSNTFNQT